MRRTRHDFKGMRPTLDATGVLMWNARMDNEPSQQAVCTEARMLEQLGARSIVFVGLMGAGKTVIGRKVATILRLPFTDSDHEIEGVSRMSVPELFERYGEPEFRALEQRVILRLLESGPQVLSTGGGAFMNAHTRSAIAEHGVSVWLKADIDTLMDRVGKNRARPLLQNPDPRGVMERLLAERYPVYAGADVTVIPRDERKDVIATEVIEQLGSYLCAGDAAETRS
jgi:shikimate kinase